MAANSWESLLSQWEATLRKAFLDAIAAIRDQAALSAIATLFAKGDIDGAVKAVGLDPAHFRPLDKAVSNAFEAGGDATAKSIPPINQNGARARVIFDVRSPAAESWMRNHSAALVTAVTDDQIEMMRVHLTNGLAKGVNPRTAALDLVGRVNPKTGHREGGMIGLTASQGEWVRAYEDELASDSPDDALARSLRDTRFDAAVRRAAAAGEPVPADLRAKMVTAYRNRALRFRAEGIARTETITAMHEGQQRAMDQAVESGAIKQAALTYIWRSARDGRVREAHRELDGKVAKAGEPFQSILGPIRFPGDPQASAANRINCRCWREPKVDFLAGVR